MFGFIRRLFSCRDDGPGYTCDGCKTWTPRSKGKALVEVKSPGVYLFCPACAELKLYAKAQAEKARPKKTVEVYDDVGKRNPEASARAQAFMNAYGVKTGRIDCSEPN